MGNLCAKCMNYFTFDLSDSKYLVPFEGRAIETIVTNEARIVDEWVHQVSSTYAGNQMLVGLDTEWMHDQNNKVAILQLCIENNCLIFQLVHMDYIPNSLRRFLVDSNFNFVGVGIMQDLQKLENEYGLECNNGIDVANVAKTQFPGRFQSNPGLKCLAKELVDLNMKKPKEVCMSNWKSKELTQDQVEYACIDAYASYMIGKELLNY